VVFEPTIPAFERAKTVHALDRAATVIGSRSIRSSEKTWIIYYNSEYKLVDRIELCLDHDPGAVHEHKHIGCWPDSRLKQYVGEVLRILWSFYIAHDLFSATARISFF
jgi:hypothetical protein